MPIEDINDAREVDSGIRRIFDASHDDRVTAIRALCVETLDFERDFQEVDLKGINQYLRLPNAAHRVAVLDGVHVLYLELPEPDSDKAGQSKRVRQVDLAAAAKSLSGDLGDDLLLVVLTHDADELHFVHPDFSGQRIGLRRIVFERNLPHRTAVQQLASIFWNWKDSDNIRQALSQAFDVEPVTKRFFAVYRRVFDAAENAITGFDESEGEEKRRFVQTIFNRLMFIYFLSRKGWLSFNEDHDYLNAVWRDYASADDETNFYTNRLKQLFFAGLNSPGSLDLRQDNPAIHRLIGDVPFLNGGLFEKTDLDRRDEVHVPDSVFKSMLGDLFDGFNFTVMESTPFDVEVAVDPEMLGKVFEELVTGRHDSGSYYTPRPVVSFMCREALKGYLEGQETGADKDAIAKFVDDRDANDIPLSAATGISNALSKVTVVDPACGSGAYLLGMMQELVELQSELFNVGVDAKGLYQLKLEIIQRNLYGVDIDDFAVNIAMLRLWLSLAIDFEGEQPEPLPNLEFKVVCGDSLRGPDPTSGAEVQGTLGSDPELVRELARLRIEFSPSHGAEKLRLKREIRRLEQSIREALGLIDGGENVFDWRVSFAEVFFASGGFDIAVANPPYVRQELIGTHKPVLVKRFADAVTARSDLYCYFYARALQLLSDGGLHVFVCSNSWLDVGYGAKLQQYLLANASLEAIYESSVERQFATADINTIISIARRGCTDDESMTAFVRLDETFERAIAAAGAKRIIHKSAAELESVGSDGTKYVGDKWGGKYLRAPDIYHHILATYGNKLVRLGDVAEVRFGIKTGANDFFYLSENRNRRIWNRTRVSGTRHDHSSRIETFIGRCV